MFEEFDYNKAKELLPPDYEPIPYVEVPISFRRSAKVAIHGFSSYEDASRFVSMYASLFPADCFEIRKVWKSAIEFNFQIIAPHTISMFFKAEDGLSCAVVTADSQYGTAPLPPVLYRTIGSKHVQNFFDKGELMLSTFKRCRNLENMARQDQHELRNIVEIEENNLKIVADVMFDDKCL